MKLASQQSLEELFKQIEQVCDKITGFTYRIEDEILEKNHLSGGKRKIKRAQLWELVKEGKSQVEIAASLSTSQSRISTLIKQEDLRDIWLERWHQSDNYHLALKSKHNLLDSRKEKLEELVAVGRTLAKIGASFDVTKQRAEEILQKSGLHPVWKEKRQEIKSQKRDYENKLQVERQSLVNLLRQREEVIAPHSPWIEVKVWQYRNIRPGNQGKPLSNESLFKLFEAYAVAKLEGKKLSCYELGAISGMSFTAAAEILRTVGLDRMYCNLDRHVTPQWKKEALQRTLDFEASSADLAYFLELSEPVVMRTRARLGRKLRTWPLYLNIHEEGKSLTYRLASQVYEAEALGFEREEIRQLLNLGPKTLQYAFDHKPEIVPAIVQLIQALYPEEKVTTPYRWKK